MLSAVWQRFLTSEQEPVPSRTVAGGHEAFVQKEVARPKEAARKREERNEPRVLSANCAAGQPRLCVDMRS